jgi:predicted pyridoxine 5'-phosphate oxidase superfamily flavin-nucleotide-binding protein
MYHPGEIEAQRRAGVRDLAERVGRIIGSTIPPPAGAFLAARSFVIAATRGEDGAVRAALLAGTRGFAHATSERAIELHPQSGHMADVAEDIAATGVLGLLAIDFSTRRRIRVNGHASVRGDAIVVETSEVYSNCPQYIHERPDSVPRIAEGQGEGAVLTGPQRTFIERAATFFIASVHPERGADASHRGGAPGFVHAEPTRLTWADYPGNNMFNTLGNLLVEPRCGLLFVDFATGDTLRVEGRAAVDWSAERTITFEIDRVLA